MYFGPETGGYKQTVGHVRRFLDHWCSIGAICWRMCQHWALGLFFVSGKSPAGPVCGITPQDPSRAGSQKRKQLSDNELLCCDQTSAFPRSGWGSWECVKNHTLTRSLSCSCTHVCMQMLASLHMERQKQNLEPNRFYYPDETFARVVSQHNINPVKVKDKHPMFATTVQPWEEEEENLSLSQNAVLFLGTPLKGLRSSLWQQRGFAVQTTHILRLTPVNWAGGFTQVCLSLESSMLPQSHMTVEDSGLLNDLA